MNKIKAQISDNILEEKDWNLYELSFTKTKHGEVRVATADILNDGGVYSDPAFLGMSLEELAKWTQYDPTGNHPEINHEIQSSDGVWDYYLTVSDLEHLIGS